jgi:hypothetical protein
MQNFVHKYGVTMSFDGWDNVAQRTLLNVMFVCSNGDVFATFAIDTSKEHKDA